MASMNLGLSAFCKSLQADSVTAKSLQVIGAISVLSPCVKTQSVMMNAKFVKLCAVEHTSRIMTAVGLNPEVISCLVTSMMVGLGHIHGILPHYR